MIYIALGVLILLGVGFASLVYSTRDWRYAAMAVQYAYILFAIAVIAVLIHGTGQLLP